MKGRLIVGALLILVLWQNAAAHYEDTGWIKFTQPDGTAFIGRGWGDEFEFQWETKDGYRYVMDYSTGFWCYATLNARGDYAPSVYVVGKHDPLATGIPKHLSRSLACKEDIGRKREGFDKILENIRNQRRGIIGLGKKGFPAFNQLQRFKLTLSSSSSLILSTTPAIRSPISII